jgi:PEP-CTERM motif
MKLGYLLIATAGVLVSAATANAANLVSNGEFTTGYFDWTVFKTSNGTLGSFPNPEVSLFNVTGAGAQDAATFNVGIVNFPDVDQGGGIFQDITTAAGTLDFSASIASYSATDNADGGTFEVLLDGAVLETYSFGTVDDTTARSSLSFDTSVTAGVHELEILIVRGFESGGNDVTPNEYITNISATQSSTVVPEPSTWTMMLLGFAGLGYAGYRPSRKDAADPVERACQDFTRLDARQRARLIRRVEWRWATKIR